MAEKKLPVFRGVVQTLQTEDKTGQEIGQIAVWENKSENENAPVLTGSITKADGTKFRVALWKGDKKAIKKGETQATL